MKTLIPIASPAMLSGRRKLIELLSLKGFEVVTSLEEIPYIIDELVFMYIFSTKSLEQKTLIKSLVRRGISLIVEFIPKNRNDVELMNRLTSSYGIEYSWIKVIDYKHNTGIHENPIILIDEIRHEILREVNNITFHKPFHIRTTKSKPLVTGNKSTITLDPETGKPLLMPRGKEVILAALHVTSKDSIIIAFSGYVFDDIALGYEGNRKLLLNIIDYLIKMHAKAEC